MLRLDSDLKQSAEGFTRYFSEREARLAELEEGSIRIQISARPSALGGRIEIQVEDSGPGFNYHDILDHAPAPDTQFSGRGISLVAELCDSLIYQEPGNRVKASFSWSDG